MISFDQFQMQDGSPIYQQIIEFVERGIIAGTIVSGDEMPSRRVLSALLGVNPNTIQKAYKFLEDDGIIESRSGAKSYVTANSKMQKQLRTKLLTQDVAVMVQNMKQMGISREEAVSLIKTAWKDEVKK